MNQSSWKSRLSGAVCKWLLRKNWILHARTDGDTPSDIYTCENKSVIVMLTAGIKEEPTVLTTGIKEKLTDIK
jgi:hypothetical protein